MVLPSTAHLEAERRLALLVRHGERLDPHPTEGDAAIGDERLVAHRERRPARGGFLVHCPEQIRHALFGALWTRDDELPLARPVVQILHDHERNTAEMIAVEVAEEDEVDVVGRLAGVLQGGEHGRAGVHEKGVRPAAHEIGALSATTAAEGVPGSQHRDLNAAFQFLPLKAGIPPRCGRSGRLAGLSLDFRRVTMPIQHSYGDSQSPCKPKSACAPARRAYRGRLRGNS